MRWVLAVIAIAACHGDPEKCEQACRNYAQLTYWKKADAEIAAAPPAERDQLRKDRLAKFSADIEKGIDFCVGRCTSANNEKQTGCLIEAKTAEAAQACVKDE
ncbi:MAG TPA: hypothetical protein VLX92_26940 [Kofleriaceae bacterium]|nr:hypothetical protein [Kofleriaceae bacterium]